MGQVKVRLTLGHLLHSARVNVVSELYMYSRPLSFRRDLVVAWEMNANDLKAG